MPPAASSRPPLPRISCLAALAVAVVLSLGACDILFSGMFPADVAQMTARVDLSSALAPQDARQFRLAIGTIGSAEYVLLFSGDPMNPSAPHLYVYSPTLSLLNSYSQNDVTGLLGSSLQGEAAISRPWNASIVVGNVELTALGAGLGLASLVPPQWGVAIGGPSPGNWAWSNFRTDSAGNLAYDAWDAGWTPQGAFAQPVGRPARFATALTDPTSTSNNTVILVFVDDVSRASWFVAVPKVPDLNAWPAPDILASGAYTVFTKTNIDADHAAVTDSGIIAYDYGTRSWTRFVPSAPDTVSSLHVGERPEGQRAAFSYAGGWYVTWDPGTRRLTRYEDWW